MENDVSITHLSFKERSSRTSFLPFLEVNCTFRVNPKSSLYGRVLSLSQSYYRTLGTKDLESVEDFSKLKTVWCLQDPCWVHLEKFQTFWFRELVSDCTTTRSCLYDLEFFLQKGKMPDIHRFTHDSVVIRHLRTLHSYWD